MLLRQRLAASQDEQIAANTGVRIMADRLSGYRILILETREEAQFSRLLAEQGADVLQCPMFTIHDAPDPTPVEAWIGRFIEKPCDDLVLMTGEGLRRLMKVARRTGGDADFVTALGKARKFARGPKPGRVSRRPRAPSSRSGRGASSRPSSRTSRIAPSRSGSRASPSSPSRTSRTR